MKVWYKSVGDTSPIIITNESVVRSDEYYFIAQCDHDIRKYSIQWNGPNPTLVLNSDYTTVTRVEALQNLKDRIVAKRQEKNSANFVYGGNIYISDEVNIQGVRIQVDGSPDSDPIPTFVGTQLASTWHTADDQFVLFNAGQFRAFATAYFSHREKNFTNYTMLTIMATQAFNTGATVEQLNNFDISQGWN